MLNIIFALIVMGIIYLNYTSFTLLLWQHRPESMEEVIAKMMSTEVISISFVGMLIAVMLLTVVVVYKHTHKNKMNFFEYKKSIIKLCVTNCILAGIVFWINYVPLVFSNLSKNLLVYGELSSFDKGVELAGSIFLFIFAVIMPCVFAKWLNNNVKKELKKANQKIMEEKAIQDSIEKERQIKLANEEKQRQIKLANEEKEKEIKVINNLINDFIVGWETTKLEFNNKKLDEKKSYNFNSQLNLKISNVQNINLNNEEKFDYYINMYNDLNNKFDGDFEKYADNLICRGKKLTNRIENLSQEAHGIKTLNKLHKNNIYFLSQYFNYRNKFISSDFIGCKSGIEGEERVNEELSLYSNIINLQNIRLEVEDNDGKLQSIESDNILLTRNGIFVLEVKNFGEIGNYDIILEKDGRWLRKNRHDGQISVLKNVTKQNNRHIGFLNKFINESTNRGFDNFIEVDGIVVIANEIVKIENYNDNQKIFRDSELYSYIKSQPSVFVKEELDEIKKVLLENNLPPKRYPVYDYHREIDNNIVNLEKYIVNCEKLVGLLEDNCKNKKYAYKETII